MKPREFQDQIDDPRVVQAITEAEKLTSGELRVFISRHPCTDPLEAAHREFDRQGMRKTPLRNAVLFYFVPASRQFAIAGDEGIHFRCGDVFWKDVAGEMSQLLKEGRFTDAIVAGIHRAGVEMARHFPKYPGDRDDLPNTVLRD